MTAQSSPVRSPARGCATNLINKGGCRLTATGLPRSTVILDVDCLIAKKRAVNQSPVCDYLVFSPAGTRSSYSLLLVELKRGRPDVTHSVRQLQGGAVLARGVLQGQTTISRLVPILACGTRPARNARRRLRRMRIRFGQMSVLVTLLRCRDALARVL